MKRIKVIAILFILFSAGLMNYHDQSMSSVNFFNGSKVVICDEQNQAKESKPCSSSDIDYSGAVQEMPSGKNYEATMVIM
jgi:hypothetical protein